MDQEKKGFLLKKKKEEEEEEALKKEEEDRQAEIKAQEEIFGKFRKFQPQIDICDNLIHFLNSMKPKTEQELKIEEMNLKTEGEVNKDIQGNWKKEKVEVYTKKTYYDDEDLGVQPGQGKKNKKKNKKQKGTNKNVDNANEKMTMNLETLSFFDEVKVAPPTLMKDIDEVVSNLETKKQYFIATSDDLNKEKEENKGENKEDNKETNEKEEEKKPKAKQVKNKNINLEDEDEFPSM